MHRRNFLKTSGMAALPALGSAIPFAALAGQYRPDEKTAPVYFFLDGPKYTPDELITKLQEINVAHAITPDTYGEGGVVEALEKKFMAVTGKQAAIYMPSGTMANQLAISVLSGPHTKVFVQETSHVFRDEADAAQSVYGKRLIPLAPGEPAFTLQQLQASLQYHEEGEVFKSGIGVVAIESPVRRCDGRAVPLDEIKKITAFCREKGYKLHFDGARVHLASAFTGVPVGEYARHFDTVYISLYKYLGAPGGAMLCGDREVIGKMRHLMKVHGGAMYQNWVNAAMALHHLEGLDERLQRMAQQAQELFTQLNKLPGIKISPLPNGSNIFHLEMGNGVDLARLRETLNKKHHMLLPGRRGNEPVRITVNESLLKRDNKSIVAAFKEALQAAKV